MASRSIVRSDVKIVNVRLIGYRDGRNMSCQPKLCQKASRGMNKVAYKYGIRLSKAKGQGQDRIKYGTQMKMLQADMRPDPIHLFL